MNVFIFSFMKPREYGLVQALTLCNCMALRTRIRSATYQCYNLMSWLYHREAVIVDIIFLYLAQRVWTHVGYYVLEILLIRLINLLNPFTKPKLMPQTVLMLSFPNMSLGQTHKGPRCDDQWWKVLARRVSVTLLDARAIRASVFGIVSWLKSTMSQRMFILTLNCCHHHLRMLCCWLYATTTYLCTLPHPAVPFRLSLIWIST